MYKIAIFGSENSHARQFTNYFNKVKAYPEMVVTHVGGDAEGSERLKGMFPELIIEDDPYALIGKVDAVMVTCRDGQYHAKYAKPFIEAGIPVFVDKPFTRDIKEAEELVELAKSKNVPLCGGSAVKTAYDILMLASKVESGENVCGGGIIAPVQMQNEYGDFWFYSSHLAEMTLRVFGYNPIEVTATELENNVTVVTKYEKFNVINQFTNTCRSYHGYVILDSGIHSRDVDISLIFHHEAEQFAQMVLTGKMPYTYEQLIMPVRYIKAVEESFKTKKTVKVL